MRIARYWQFAPQFVLASAITTYIVVFGVLTWNQQTNFGTFGFDMGIYDQGIWLLSQFENPFITVRGLPFFGHHVNFSTLLLVPFYWLGAGPRFLYLAETVMLAAGAIPLWLLGRHLMKNAWIALLPAAAYLLYPSLQWINWWHFHPDTLIITPLLFAWWFARIESWRLFVVAIVLALLAKEDAALAVAAMGTLITIRACFSSQSKSREMEGPPGHKNGIFQVVSCGQNKSAFLAGLATIAAGIGWWIVCTKLIIPYMNDGAGPFYSQLFPGFGNSPLEVLKTIVTRPSLLIATVTSPEHVVYYTKLFSPTAFLSLFSPATLIAGPQLLVNSISAHSYTHDIRYHYNAVVIVGIFLGTIEAIAWAGQRWIVLKFLLPVVVMISSVVANINWSPSPLGRAYSSGIWAQPQEKHLAIRAALDLIPAEAAVTASYYIVPHLTHRKLIYEFPNPFRVANWGIAGENGGNPDDVDFLVIDLRYTGNDTELYESLISAAGPYEIIFSEDEIQIAARKLTN